MADNYVLPRVSDEAIEEFVRRNEREEYRPALFERIREENPTLLDAMFALNIRSSSERASHLALLMQTYALLSIQYELDSKKSTN